MSRNQYLIQLNQVQETRAEVATLKKNGRVLSGRSPQV